MNYQAALIQLPLVCEAKSDAISEPAEVRRVCDDMATLAQESFQILTMNVKNKMINRHLITLGLVNSSAVHPREVFRPAITDGATGIILVHNHPSGDVTPSTEDIDITKKLILAGEIISIPVLDHVVIGTGEPEFCSLRERGLVAFD